MTEADCLHSTPPLNTPVDQARRRLLAIAAGGAVAATIPSGAAATIEARDGTDAAIFAAIQQWRALWGAEELLPDFDPAGAELRRKAYDLEWDIAAMVPATIDGYRAKCEALRNFDLLDHEDSIEILWQLAHDAGRLGVDREMPDIRTPI